MTISTQAITLLSMIGMGSWLGASMDTYFRIFNRKKRKAWLVILSDLLFWVFQGLLIFYVLYLVNHGEVRFYLLLAVLCGYSAYQGLIKTIYLRILEWVITFVVNLYKLITRIIQILVIKPVVFIFTTVISLILFIYRIFLRILKLVWKIIYFLLKMIVKPIVYITKLLWNLLPESFRIKSDRVFRKVLNTFRKIINGIKQRIRTNKK